VSLDSKQFADLIERVLGGFGKELNSPVAVKLLLGTAAHESRFGTYLKQIRGPAIGIFQMEPDTFRWLQDTYQDTYVYLKGREPEEMEWDLRLAILAARLRYWIVPKPLPHDDVQSIAGYWKRWYNTSAGAGTEEQFIDAYEKYVS